MLMQVFSLKMYRKSTLFIHPTASLISFILFGYYVVLILLLQTGVQDFIGKSEYVRSLDFWCMKANFGCKNAQNVH